MDIWQILPWRCTKCGQCFGFFNRSNVTRAASGKCCVCETFDKPTTAATRLRARGGMGPLAKPVVESSPYTIRFAGSSQASLTVSVNYNLVTRALGTTTVVRDVGCEFTKLVIGVGLDGTVETSSHTFNIPNGTTNVTATQLSRNGLATIEDVLDLQITAQ